MITVEHVSSPLRITIVTALILTIGGAACSSDSSDAVVETTLPAVDAATTTTTAAPQVFDIVGTALTAGPFTELAGLVVDAGLVDTLREPGPFTVFAPTDAAFQKLPVDSAAFGGKTTRRCHDRADVSRGSRRLKLADLQPGKLTTVAGIDLTVTREGDKVLINGFEIAAGDVVASNGIIHVMSDVLLPPG